MKDAKVIEAHNLLKEIEKATKDLRRNDDPEQLKTGLRTLAGWIKSGLQTLGNGS